MYFHAPQAMKTLLTTVYGLNQRRIRYREVYQDTLAALEESQYWDNRQLAAYEEEKVGDFLHSARRSCSYYSRREVYSRFHGLADLPALPELTKDTIRHHLAELRSDDVSPRDVNWVHTSGTTGSSLHFPVSRSCFQREYAYRALHYRWCGYTYESRAPMVICQGHPVADPDRSCPPFWVVDRAEKFLLMSSYHLSRNNLLYYARQLDAFEPVVATGYPSSLYLLARGYLRYGRGTLRLKGVYTTSETLLAFQRPVIEEAFKCKVFDSYGNTERCGYIAQCELGERHLKREHSYAEVVDSEGQPVGPGGTGRLLWTGFGNRAFPLIRYAIGDMVKMSKDQTPRCGRSGPLVDEVLGRAEEFIVAADGRLVGRLDHVFKDSQNVLAAQIVQNVPGEVTLRISCSEEYGPKDERALRDEAALRLGSATKVCFEYVPFLKRGPNGKLRFVVSSVDQERLMRELSFASEPLKTRLRCT